MLYAWIDGDRRQPIAKGERTTCRDCGGLLSSVIPVENVRHWRHRGGDCDSWSEPEGPWHLGWKEHFDLDCREVPFRDPHTGERHRADVFCGAGTQTTTVLELQHSSISEEERASREAYYGQIHRMFWLVHVHDETSFTGTNFGLSLGMRSRVVPLDGKQFWMMRWVGRSQFIEKWKRARMPVFLDWRGHVFYLASEGVSRRLNGGLPAKKGEFALSPLSREEFISAVKGQAPATAAL